LCRLAIGQNKRISICHGGGMKREVTIGGQSFVIDDPHGSLMQVSEIERKAEQAETVPIEVSVRQARTNYVEPMPDNNDPIQSIRGRGMLAERIARGQISAGALVFAWITLGIPCLCVVAMIVSLMLPRLISGELAWHEVIARIVGFLLANLFPGFGIYLLISGTLGAIKRRARPQTGRATSR
jgi:hypothetical protein